MAVNQVVLNKTANAVNVSQTETKVTVSAGTSTTVVAQVLSKPAVSITATAPSLNIQQGQAQVIEVVAAGPQGPEGPAGSGFSLDQTAKIDKSLVYFDLASGQYKADDIITQTKLTDGGNF